MKHRKDSHIETHSSGLFAALGRVSRCDTKVPPLLGVLLACLRGSVGAGVATLCVEMGQAPEVLTGARGPHCEKVLSASDRKLRVSRFALTHSRHFVQCSSGGQGIEIREGASGESSLQTMLPQALRRAGGPHVRRGPLTKRSSSVKQARSAARPCDGGPRPDRTTQ